MTSSVPLPQQTNLPQPPDFANYSLSPAARQYFDPIVYGGDAAKWGGGLLSAPTWLGGRGKSAEEIQDLVRAASRAIAADPGQYRFNSGANRFLNLETANLKDESGNALTLPGLDGGKSFVNSPEFQQALYKELQERQFEAQAYAPQTKQIQQADGKIVTIELPSLSDRAQALAADPNFEARLTGRGAVYDDKGKLIRNFAGDGGSRGTMVRDGGEGSAVLNPRVDLRKAEKQIAELEALKTQRQLASGYQASGDLTDAQITTLADSTINGVNVLRAAMLTGDPRLTQKLKTLNAAGANNRARRISAETIASDTAARETATYGTVDPKTGERTGGTTEGRQSIEAHDDRMATNLNTREHNTYRSQLQDYQTRLGAYQWNQQRKDNLTAAKDTLELERYKVQEANKRAQWEYEENERQRKFREAENEKQRLYEARNRGWGSIGNIFQMFYGNSF